MRLDNGTTATAITTSITTDTITETTPLGSLAVEITKAHEQATRAAQSSLEAARRAGELLREVKSRLPHGDWLTWLARHCPHISRRVASNYMRIARRWDDLTANGKRDSNLPVREALRLVRRPRSSNEWYSPAELVKAASLVMGGIDLDPASSAIANATVKATRYITIEENGLMHDWPGRVWLNPPYAGQAGTFVRHLLDQFDRGITTAAVLLISAVPTGSSWFQPLLRDWPICFAGRVNYFTPAGIKKQSINASVLVYLGPEPALFAEVFEQFGPVLRRMACAVTAAPMLPCGDIINAETAITSLAMTARGDGR